MLKLFMTSIGSGMLLSGTFLLSVAEAQPAAPANPAVQQPAVAPAPPPPANNQPSGINVNTPAGSVQVQPNQPANVQPGQPANIQPGQPASVQPGQPGNAPHQGQGQLVRAKQVLGSKVQLSGNVSAGTVDDFVVDEAGYVEYVIVNNNGQFVTVPWDAAQFNFEKQTAVINIEQEQFKKIPTYTADKYPVFSEPQYRTTVYRSYGLTPRERPAILPRNRRP